MSVIDGQSVNQTVTNAAFLSRLTDSDTVAMIGLLRAASGANVTDVQKLLNYLIGVTGMTSESNNSLDYASNNYITDGQSLKVAMGLLDAALFTLSLYATSTQTDLDALEITVSGLGGGGGGGGLRVISPAGNGAIIGEEFGNPVAYFAQGELQVIRFQYRVPSNHVSGTQLKMRFGVYTPATTAATYAFNARTYLVQPTAGVDSTANLFVDNTPGDLAGVVGVANAPLFVTYNLTNGSGQINAVTVAADDLLNIELRKETPAAGTEDTNDSRVMIGLIEVYK